MMTGQKLHFGLVVRFLSRFGRDFLLDENRWQKQKNTLDRNSSECCGIQSDSTWYSSVFAWNSCFSRVIEGTYAREQDFDVALFNALKESLSEVADPQSVVYDTNENIKEFLLKKKPRKK
jgi:hypothetical protein